MFPLFKCSKYAPHRPQYNLSKLRKQKQACGPIVTLLTSWAWHVKTPSLESFLNILLIAFSVALAVAGEVQFSWLGVIYQLASLVFDANRLVMIQILLSDEGQKMDPLVTLYYSAPVCAFTNFMIAFYTELRGFSWSVVGETGFGVLLANAAVGFMLNVSIFVLVCISRFFSVLAGDKVMIVCEC